MKKNNILRKININQKYNFAYIYKPMLILSAFSILIYILKLNGFSNADELFLFAELTVLSVSYYVNCNNFKHTVLANALVLVFMIFYICFIDDVTLIIAEKCSKNSVMFGVVNSIYNSFSIDKLENLIYHTAYGSSMFINGEIVTGAVDIYNAGKITATSALFLCGKFFTLFSSIGITFTIAKKYKEIYLITLCALLTGNMSVYLIMLILNFTPYYFLYIFFVFISYFVASFAGIISGFSCSGSIIELFIQRNNIVYIIAIGIFLCAVSYYASRLVNEKLKW